MAICGVSLYSHQRCRFDRAR